MIHSLGRQDRSKHAKTEDGVSHSQQYGESESAEAQRPSIGQVEDRIERQVEREKGDVESCIAPACPQN